MDVRKKRRRWTSELEDVMITMWAQKNHELLAPGKNTQVYAAIVEKFKEYNIDINNLEVKKKIESLRKRFDIEKNQVDLEGSSSWVHYKKIAKILAQSKVINHDLDTDEITQESIFLKSDDSLDFAHEEEEWNAEIFATGSLTAESISNHEPDDCEQYDEPAPKKIKVGNEIDRTTELLEDSSYYLKVISQEAVKKTTILESIANSFIETQKILIRNQERMAINQQLIASNQERIMNLLERLKKK
ncbi:uncharacterized protein LOC132788440 [Drosophila nasuta]|uniref:uncharacterized protein LOC132788440 n=1 Tax=Drosophila nasuta TaxID=42062 RepID=UPI00295F3BE7|nr:uncharacterized protein LOC132788440 [Drosophila nasuta]